MVKFEEISYGWNIQFDVNLTLQEVSNCNIEHLEHVGDYDIQLNDNVISFNCLFDRGELRKNETIEERLNLIQFDIDNLVTSCI